MTISLGNPFLNKTFQISQGFGENARDYSEWNLIAHNGIDYACPVGTEIYAVALGTVTKIQTDEDGYGLHIRIQHPNGVNPEFRTIYAHLSNVTVRLGQTVLKGEIIGRSGNSGNSTGPHLHFEMRLEPQDDSNGYNGACDPTPYFDDAVIEPEVPLPTDYDIPKSGKATVTDPSGLNIRKTPSTIGGNETVYGRWYTGFEITYEAIIKDGGDIWMKYSLFGNEFYSAAFYGGNWLISFSEV